MSEEEDTDVWLDCNLTKLNVKGMNMNNQSDRKMTHLNPSAEVNNTAPNQHVNRKPYNAADYGSLHKLTRCIVHCALPAFSNLNVPHTGIPKSSQSFTYQNGSQKEVLADGTTTVYFTNGDRKRTYANEKKWPK